MKTSPLKYFRLSGSLLVTITILFLYSCDEFSKKEAEKFALQRESDIEHGVNVEMLYTEQGRPNVKLRAPKAERHLDKEPYMEFPEGIELFIYDVNRNIESFLKADYGYAKENQQEMIARKNVEVINVDGDTLRTEELIWDQKKKKIYSETYVEIRTKDEIIYGEGMEADENFTNYTIKKITGSIQIQQDEEVSKTP
ncbi:MAG: LPS export ABC transporter periplasmic protein LptC [Chitinophagales bacterium]|nr:LPS export ABC transporter periplasmic protein LptC [Chitinophagales bacterium]